MFWNRGKCYSSSAGEYSLDIKAEDIIGLGVAGGGYGREGGDTMWLGGGAGRGRYEWKTGSPDGGEGGLMLGVGGGGGGAVL